MKPTKDAISIVFEDEAGRVLTVRRSKSKASFPGFWSLPSTWIDEGESIVAAAERLGKEKLGIQVVALSEKIVGTSEAERELFILQMSDYKIERYSGDFLLNPDEYTEMRWVTPEELKGLFDKEHDGVMGECCRAYLKAKGVI